MQYVFKKLVFILLFSCCTLSAYAFTIDKIVIFGDSLSDNGNMFNLTSGKIPRNPPYYAGHFSDGMAWVEYVASALRLNTQDKTEFADYAYAKAWGSDLNDIDPLSFFTLSSEIDEYVQYASKHGAQESNHLFSIWIGNNDYLGGDKTLSDDTATTLTVNAIKSGIETLIADGARHFLILNLTNLGVTPSSVALGPDVSGRLTRLSYLHNSKLSLMLNDLKISHPDIDIIEVNLMAYFEDLLQHPEKYKFKVIDRACYDGDFGNLSDPGKQFTATLQHKVQLNGKYYAQSTTHSSEWSVCSNPDEYIYWDSLHPTAHVHRLLANFVLEELKKHDIHRA
jgi:phospholipase/lecithinase/hemolysin